MSSQASQIAPAPSKKAGKNQPPSTQPNAGPRLVFKPAFSTQPGSASLPHIAAVRVLLSKTHEQYEALNKLCLTSHLAVEESIELAHSQQKQVEELKRDMQSRISQVHASLRDGIESKLVVPEDPRMEAVVSMIQALFKRVEDLEVNLLRKHDYHEQFVSIQASLAALTSQDEQNLELRGTLEDLRQGQAELASSLRAVIEALPGIASLNNARMLAQRSPLISQQTLCSSSTFESSAPTVLTTFGTGYREQEIPTTSPPPAPVRLPLGFSEPVSQRRGSLLPRNRSRRCFEDLQSLDTAESLLSFEDLKTTR